MLEYFLIPQNLPFSVALVVMLFIALIEGVGMLLGAGLSNVIESFLPDIDIVDIDLDIDSSPAFEIGGSGGIEAPELEGPGAFTRALAWLRVGQVPILVLFVVFLTSFGLVGLFLQNTVNGVLGFHLPAIIASVPALIISVPFVRICGGVISKIIPKDETSVVSIDSLIGRVARITLGTAKKNYPAQAHLRDQHGQDHYVMVVPDEDGDEFNKDDEVLLVLREGSRFRVIKNSMNV